MQKKYKKLHKKYDNLKHLLAQSKFAEGLGENESLGETIKMKGPTKLETYAYSQADAEDEFAEGLGENESLGETIKMKGPTKLETYAYS